MAIRDFNIDDGLLYSYADMRDFKSRIRLLFRIVNPKEQREYHPSFCGITQPYLPSL